MNMGCMRCIACGLPKRTCNGKCQKHGAEEGHDKPVQEQTAKNKNFARPSRRSKVIQKQLKRGRAVQQERKTRRLTKMAQATVFGKAATTQQTLHVALRPRPVDSDDRIYFATDCSHGYGSDPN